jgi:putative tryptophan/tyrosine transport system substrate-binding protein
MKRREFIAALGGAAASTSAFRPRAARAQASGRVRNVGALFSGAESDSDSQMRLAAFRRGLTELGWKEGENIHIEWRWSNGKSELIRQYAQELIALAPDVILANSTSVVTAFKNLTTTVPVVFALVIDPVAMGYVQSLARPGGNFTGFTFINPELIGKWTELLKSVAPGVVRAALLFDPAGSPFYDGYVRELNAARQPREIELFAMRVSTDGELEAAIKTLAQAPGNGLAFGPDPFNQVHIRQIAQLAGQYRLPAVSVYRPFAAAGGLMAYGPDTADIFRRSAGYVDRILKGASPAELPVQQPDKFDFIFNLKTAKAFDLTVPPLLLATADEVIE